MTYITISTSTCFSRTSDFNASVDVIDVLSQLKYDGESGTSLLTHKISFLGFYDKNAVPLDDIIFGLFSYTFEGNIKKCCYTFPVTSVHSFNHMFQELGCSFFFYDQKALNHKILKLLKAYNKSITHFYHHLCHYSFEFLEDEFDRKFLSEIFQYLVHISENPHELESFKPLPVYLDVRASKLERDKVVVQSDPLSPSHQIALAPQDEVGELVNLPVELPPSPPTLPALDFYIDLDCNPDGCHMVSSLRLPSTSSFDPSDFSVLCSSVVNSTCDVDEDQVMEGASVGNPTYTISFDEYVWDSNQEAMMKDDLLLSAPCSLYPGIFYDSSISDFFCENLSSNVSTSDHSQNL